MKYVKYEHFYFGTFYKQILPIDDSRYSLPKKMGEETTDGYVVRHWSFRFLKKDKQEVIRLFENGLCERFNILFAYIDSGYHIEVTFDDAEKDLIRFVDHMIKENRILKRHPNGKSINFEGCENYPDGSWSFYNLFDYYNGDDEQFIDDYELILGEKFDNQIIEVGNERVGEWDYYFNIDNPSYDVNKVGKWMYFTSAHTEEKLFNIEDEFTQSVVINAVALGITRQAKRTNVNWFKRSLYDACVCLFYTEIDNIEEHKKIINYMRENNLIQRTKSGRLYNISFKLDNQTRSHEYGGDFKSELKLADLMNLETEEWLI